MSKGYEIIHVTTVHPRNDTRIFRKMCTDLAAAGFEVSLFTTDGLPSEEKNNVKIVNLDKRRTMIARIMISHVFVLLKILKNRNAIYHFHDPELLVIGAILSILKFNVVLDFHEDTAKQIEQKHYINPYFRKVISLGYKFAEGIAGRIATGLIFATPAIATSVGETLNDQHVVVNNYVKITEFEGDVSLSVGDHNKYFCYIGVISFDRCIAELLDSLSHMADDYRFILAGQFESKVVETYVFSHKNFNRVIYKGIVDRNSFKSICQDSVCGILLFKPVGNHVESQPNKMWEYLVCNTRLVATDFSYWKNLLRPFDEFVQFSDNTPTSIARAVEAQASSSKTDTVDDYVNCANSVTKLYSWESELKKLTCFYEKILLN